jgi:hypothetical protein
MNKAVLTAALSLMVSPLALAQQPTDADRLDRLERELQRLRDDVTARDARIAELERQLSTRPGTPATVPAGLSDAEVERTREQVLQDISLRQRPAAMRRTGASFNPDIAVIINGLGSVSNRRANDAYNRFDIGEVELDLRHPIGPRVDGVVVLAFEREVENPLFPGDEEEEGEGGPENKVKIEEAFVFIHDTGIANLTAKLGRFHVRFGRQNFLHGHDLPTADVPLVLQSFLSPEALIDSGLSLSYVIPPDRIGGQYVELIAEILSGEGADSESPTLRGDFSVDSPAINLHALWNTDLNPDMNLELGASYLWGRASSDNSEHVHLFGLDATLIRRDPSGGFNNQVFQAEWIYGLVDQPEGGDQQRSMGFYLLFQQQLNRDWYVGIRGDWTQDANDDSREAWALSPYVSWYWSEFLRFRTQYQYRDVEGERAAHILWFQVTAVFGAHPPHPYWSMK